MGRYIRVVIALFLLAVVYLRIGGFDSEFNSAKTSFEPESAQFADSITPIGETTEPETQQDEITTRSVVRGSPPTEQTTLSVENDVAANREQAATSLATAIPSEFTAAVSGPAAPVLSSIKIGRNESFYVALQRAGLGHEIIMELVSACKPHTNLRRVKRGDVFKLETSPEGEFRSLRFDLDSGRYLELTQADGSVAADIHSFPVQRVLRGVHGVIESNLFDSLVEAGADPLLADEIADILGWNIDFFRDLRRGDEFSLLYEEFVYENRQARESHVLAIQFENQGRDYDAFVFENSFGLPSYYDGSGQSLERQFLRAPLKYTRISSGFTNRRLHPVTKQMKPHWGVDYVAPTGTPVLATADGVVIKRARNRGSGNHVGIRHGQGYESYYLHLSKFPRELKVGDRVRQGDVVGFVGSTGWATAPHLDYRIKKNGKWTNPKKLDLPPAEPIADSQREAFERERLVMLEQLLDQLGGEIVVIGDQLPRYEFSAGVISADD
jgi:murein DD-endopeptidase MepM/ murein hydrolase activator NlpD